MNIYLAWRGKAAIIKMIICLLRRAQDLAWDALNCGPLSGEGISQEIEEQNQKHGGENRGDLFVDPGNAGESDKRKSVDETKLLKIGKVVSIIKKKKLSVKLDSMDENQRTKKKLSQKKRRQKGEGTETESEPATFIHVYGCTKKGGDGG